MQIPSAATRPGARLKKRESAYLFELIRPNFVLEVKKKLNIFLNLSNGERYSRKAQNKIARFSRDLSMRS